MSDIEYDFDIWHKTFDPVLYDINKKSRLPEKWISFQNVMSGKYKNSIIKPINRYVENLYQAPKLISINNNIITLRQENHAEFFLLIKKNGIFYNLDRPWMRQYYNTKFSPDVPSDCFSKTYKFYVPWFIDAKVKIKYVAPDCNTPFFIYETESKWEKNKENEKYIEPDFVAFNFKSVGPHMINDKFGKIKRNSAMFDMVFEADDIMIERVRKFYEEN
jgi:hypothetical protein